MKDKRKQAENIALFEKNSNKFEGERLIQVYINSGVKVVVNPFDQTYCSEDLDNIYKLPFERKPHPKYAKRGAIPAFDMIKYSVNIHRGCFGGCAFCTIAAHQGKRIISRSEKSIMNEIEQISQDKDFKGYLSDLGGPSANMYSMKGKDENLCKKCTRPSCLYPTLCKNMNNDHHPLLNLYKKVRALLCLISKRLLLVVVSDMICLIGVSILKSWFAITFREGLKLHRSIVAKVF